MAFGTLIRTHPARVAATALRDAERALGRAQRVGHVPAWAFRTDAGFAPSVRAVENETAFVITAELPGVDPGDLDVAIEDGVLSIDGLRKGAAWSEEQSDEEKAQNSARFSRRIRFNGEIDEDAVAAAYKNGLLTVTVPKPAVPEPTVRSIPVQVG